MIADKKEGNIFEFSIIGIFDMNSYGSLKLISEEICENNLLSYFYEISTYFLQSQQGFQNVTNLIEYHHNLFEKLRTEHKIDNESFYNGVNYMEKFDDYLNISKFFLKYITNSYVQFPLGSCSIIEMARCEENMDSILTSLGYKEKSRIKKRGDFVKFKNLPIIILFSYVEIQNIDQMTETIHSEKNLSESQKKNENKNKIINIIEIIGFCYENEKESLMNRLQIIKEKLGAYCTFESDVKNP